MAAKQKIMIVDDDNNIADNFVGECYSAGQATPKEALDNMMQYDFFEKKS